MMMVALFATAFVSCSEDIDDEINNEEPQKVESLVSTQWRYRVGTIGQNGFIQVFVSFINDVSAAVSINKQEGGTPTAKAMGGSYTYSDGQGSIECKDLTNGTAMGTATFTIKDNTMAFTYDNETYTLKRSVVTMAMITEATTIPRRLTSPLIPRCWPPHSPKT